MKENQKICNECGKSTSNFYSYFADLADRDKRILCRDCYETEVSKYIRDRIYHPLSRGKRDDVDRTL